MLVKLFLVDCWQLKKGKERNESDDASRCLEDGFQVIMRGGEKVNSHTGCFLAALKQKSLARPSWNATSSSTEASRNMLPQHRL